MEENNPENANAAAAQGNPQSGQLRLQKVYVKDVSFETPNTPAIFMEQIQATPNVDLQIATQNTMPAENMFEVVIHVTATVKLEDKTAFLVEVEQAGLFTLMDFPAEQQDYLLGAYCPNQLFPYVREAISDLVSRGGFPPLMLEPVNFDAIYAQHKAKQQAEAQGATATAQ